MQCKICFAPDAQFFMDHCQEKYCINCTKCFFCYGDFKLKQPIEINCCTFSHIECYSKFLNDNNMPQGTIPVEQFCKFCELLEKYKQPTPQQELHDEYDMADDMNLTSVSNELTSEWVCFSM
jgi:hypothetical protein